MDAQQLVSRVGKTIARGIAQQHQAPRVLHREKTQHQAIQHTEERGIGADAQRQRKHRGGGKRRVPAHVTHGEAQVLQHRLESGQHVAVPRGFAQVGAIAEQARGLATGLRGRGAGGDQIIDALFEVELELLVDFGIDAVRPERIAKSAQQRHRASYAKFRMVATAAVTFCHFFSSAASWRRPAAVNS